MVVFPNCWVSLCCRPARTTNLLSYSLPGASMEHWQRTRLSQEEKEDRIEMAEGLSEGRSEMCDYSLHSIKSRSAKIGDKLTTRDFGTGTRGFAASENPSVAVCVLPGTELAFAHEVKRLPVRLWPWHDSTISHRTAIFRQINKDKVAAHHDALEF